LLDRRTEIDVAHLEAALALWEYSEASALRIFGDSLGDPVADDILTALHQAGSAGMTRTSVRDLFGRNQGSDRIGVALAKLASKGLAIMENRRTGGRPVETWFATLCTCREFPAQFVTFLFAIDSSCQNGCGRTTY
jgi:hypothetical protein